MHNDEKIEILVNALLNNEEVELFFEDDSQEGVFVMGLRNNEGNIEIGYVDEEDFEFTEENWCWIHVNRIVNVIGD